MIYGSGDPGRSHGGWEIMAGQRQIDTPCRESLGMGGLFSAYWEGIGEERGRERGTETEREEERGGQRQRLPSQKKRE